MLDTSQKLEIVSDSEIRQLLIDTLIKYEQKAILKCFVKFSFIGDIPAVFCQDNEGLNHYQFYIKPLSGTDEVAEHHITNLPRTGNDNEDVKHFVTKYVAQITNGDLAGLQHYLEAEGSYCKYPKLQHKLTIWAMSNFTRLQEEPNSAMLSFNKHGDDFVVYLLSQNKNHWDKLPTTIIDNICEKLSVIILTNHLTTTMIIKEVNHTLLQRTNVEKCFYSLIELALHYHVHITIPITTFVMLRSLIQQLDPKQIQPMTLITQTTQEINSVIAYLATKDYNNSVDGIEAINFLYDHGFLFDSNGFDNIYQTWLYHLSACPEYKQVEPFANVVSALKIMFPKLGK